MPDEDRSQRTEEPTPKRLEDARKKGQVPQSREIASAMVLVVLAGGFAGLASTATLGLLEATHAALSGHWVLHWDAHALTSEGWLPAAWTWLKAWGMWALPAWLLAGLAVWLITGPVWSTAPLKPDPKRISPAQGWRRLFSAKAAVEWLKALVKLAVLVGIAWAVGRGAWASMQRASVAGVEAVARMGVKLAAEFFAYTAAALVALALLDGLYQRWQHRRELRMTPKELKDEYKETEGDPQIKARIREMQAQISRRRMMAEVPKADVVVVNPTHLAVALRYRHGRDPAPRVVAKGRERTAQRIREIARAHRVPIRHDPPLARALIRVPLGKPIPEALYEAVARVLAEIYRARTPPTEA